MSSMIRTIRRRMVRRGALRGGVTKSREKAFRVRMAWTAAQNRTARPGRLLTMLQAVATAFGKKLTAKTKEG